MANKKEITLKEIKEHNKPNDLWFIIDEKVYNVTKYRLEHPGGEEALDEVAGGDATKDFRDVGHSKEAQEIMKKFYIGDLAESDRKKPFHITCGIAVSALIVGFVAAFLIRRTFTGKR